MKKLFLAAAAALFALAAPAGGQTIVRCRTSGGSAIDCAAPLGNSYVNWASPGAIGSVTPAAVTATTFTGSGSGLTSVPAASVTGSLSGVTINCSSNTCSNIANASLTNSSITLSCTGLSGCGTVALGATISPAVVYGTGSNTATQGNDTRLPPTPTTAGKIPYDTGSGYSSTATGGSSTTVLHGGTTPAYGAVSLTADVSGVAPVANGGTNSSTALNNNRAIVSSGGKLVETASACAAGTVLVGGSPPDCGGWITATAGISTLGSTYTISADNGSFEDTGLSVTLPSSGTYILWYTARTNISASGTAGAFITVEMYNSTDAVALANTEEIGAYGSTLSTSYYGVPHLVTTTTVAASKVIKLYAKTTAPGTTTIRTVNSDTNGRTNLGYLKIAP